MQVEIGTTHGPQSMRISFTDQRLTAHGGMMVWSQFLHQSAFRTQLAKVLPHAPTSNHAYDPADVALGFLGGILSGADKLSRIAYLRQDPAIPQVLGIEAVPSQSTLSRFLATFRQSTSEGLTALHRWAVRRLPSERDGYTLDLDSWALLHEDGHQEGVQVGYTKQGLKPCHRPLVAALAEGQLIANFWLRRGDAACVNHAAGFVRSTLAGLPAHIRVALVRADGGFCSREFLDALRELRQRYIVAQPLRAPVQRLCRHDDAHWRDTEIASVQVQEVAGERPGERIIVIRQRIAERAQAGGKTLFDLPAYRFQALLTNLPSNEFDALAVWRRYNGRADIENRIKELGRQFGIKGLCCQQFWATEAACHLAITAYNLCALLQRRLGQLGRCELVTLRWRLFTRAAVFSRAQGKATLKLAVEGRSARDWWLRLLEKLTALPNCHAIASLQA